MRAVSQQHALEDAGIESFDRPLLFDVLPLVARTFDAHLAIEKCFRDAQDREEKFEQRRMKERRKSIEGGRQAAIPGMRSVFRRASVKNRGLELIQEQQQQQQQQQQGRRRQQQQRQGYRLHPIDSAHVSLSAQADQPISKATRSSHLSFVPPGSVHLPGGGAQMLSPSVSAPNFKRQRLPPLRSLTPGKNVRGLLPLRSSTGLVAALPVQTYAERMAIFACSRQSAAPVSRRLAARPRTPW